ncbi:MAG: hypothetical protein GWN00_09705 [Aliifodinibius sp.]|nr:hypothetical protein [candidate division Zixibacteria bacterium]NIT56484.1 hypothetical protein [Fodinibius sp.]NIV11469.1 hypothetical protein [Fodinibius sp.]NIY25067.1 hypothetical protein [Fodinibius sp.]
MSGVLKIILIASLLINVVAVWGLLHYIYYGGSPLGELKRKLLGSPTRGNYQDPLHEENLRLKKEVEQGKYDSLRVVFLGASITHSWNLEKYFPEIHPVNRGIGGLAPSLLTKFKENVLDLKPRAVVIKFCSINMRPSQPLRVLQDALDMMVQLSKANQITPIVCTIIPAGKPSAHIGDYSVADSIQEFNRWVREYTDREQIELIDYAAAIQDDKGFLPRKYSKDPVHLNERGYEVISNAARPRIYRILDIEG